MLRCSKVDPITHAEINGNTSRESPIISYNAITDTANWKYDLAK